MEKNKYFYFYFLLFFGPYKLDQIVVTVVASAQLCYKIIFLLIPEYAGAMSSMLVLQPGTVKVLRPADSRNRATATYASQPTWPATLRHEVSRDQEQGYRHVGLTAHLAYNIGP